MPGSCRTSNGAVLVDAGLDTSGAAIIAELKAEGVEPRQVQAVLITHGHPDHYAAARLFEKATIAVGSGDVAMIRGDKTHYSTIRQGLVGAVMPLPPAPLAITAVRGDEQLEFDGLVQGHRHSGTFAGKRDYLYKDVLFTGDSLMRKNDGVAIVPALFSEDAGRNRDSLRAPSR